VGAREKDTTFERAKGERFDAEEVKAAVSAMGKRPLRPSGERPQTKGGLGGGVGGGGGGCCGYGHRPRKETRLKK